MTRQFREVQSRIDSLPVQDLWPYATERAARFVAASLSMAKVVSIAPGASVRVLDRYAGAFEDVIEMSCALHRMVRIGVLRGPESDLEIVREYVRRIVESPQGMVALVDAGTGLPETAAEPRIVRDVLSAVGEDAVQAGWDLLVLARAVLVLAVFDCDASLVTGRPGLSLEGEADFEAPTMTEEERVSLADHLRQAGVPVEPLAPGGRSMPVLPMTWRTMAVLLARLQQDPGSVAALDRRVVVRVSVGDEECVAEIASVGVDAASDDDAELVLEGYPASVVGARPWTVDSVRDAGDLMNFATIALSAQADRAVVELFVSESATGAARTARATFRAGEPSDDRAALAICLRAASRVLAEYEPGDVEVDFPGGVSQPPAPRGERVLRLSGPKSWEALGCVLGEGYADVVRRVTSN